LEKVGLFWKKPYFFFKRLKLDQLRKSPTFSKKALLFPKKPYFFQKSPTFSRKSPTFSTKTAYPQPFKWTEVKRIQRKERKYPLEGREK
jgi:hypothetical protein